jgi:hypothetical protein
MGIRQPAFAMDPVAPAAAPLSLQDKLDLITHDRKILAVLRELMRHGLHEGDVVQHCNDGSRGRLVVLRSADEPTPVVKLDDGTQVLFRATDWHRAVQ